MELFKKIGFILLILVFALFQFSFFYVIVYGRVNPYVTPVMVLKIFQGNGIIHHWSRLETISPNMSAAVIAGEDQRFFEHNGFDFKAIQEAIENNKRGYTTRGASTISQQVAKNVFLFPQRSWLRKGLEAYYTVLIEAYWSKKRILEVYLNIAETGKGLYGVGIAAEQYYKRKPKDLTRYQSAAIAAALPNPLIFAPTVQNPYATARAWWIYGHIPRYYNAGK